MKRALATAALCLFAGTSGVPALATDAPARPDIEKGKAIVAQVCGACHGADGNSPSSANPRLAGQIKEYVEKQLKNFKAAQGTKAERDNAIMAGMAAGLSPEDMRNVAAYFASQTAKGGAAGNRNTIDAGRKLFRGGDTRKGLPACAGCHGTTGAGLPAQYPRLAGQYAEYTESQLKAFREGQRANDANQVMRTIAARMTDAEIRAVSDYIAGLR